MVQPLWKISWQILKKFNTELPAILPLDIYPREVKVYGHTKTYT